ncbi:mitochondrial carrier [Hypoxylon fuscum]|nr:mitochondrial carrier [Hypoxylon fuscum]
MPSSSFLPNNTGISADKFLPALQHAISGSAGTLISTCTLYPLSLVITRLQLQRQLQREGRLRQPPSKDDGTTTTGPSGREGATGPQQDPTYGGIAEAFSRIWSSDGGLKAFYTGLGQDAIKSVLDSFLFFLFYEWFRSIRLAARQRRRGADRLTSLAVLEELAVGMAAGACSKLFTTPISNVVTRKQTTSLVDADGEVSVRQIIGNIRKEKGFTGLWSGYSANLVLALNPSITFFLEGFLKKKTVKAEKWDHPGAHMTFLLAAVSKTIATAVTYPFQTAKTRMQTGLPAVKDFGKQSIFGTVAQIARAEGVGALYDGLPGQLLLGFLGHGTTMLAKDAVHRLMFRLYFFAASVLAELRARRAARTRAAGGARSRAPPQQTSSAPKEAPAPVPAITERSAPEPLPLPAPEPVRADRALPAPEPDTPAPPARALPAPPARPALPAPETPPELPPAGFFEPPDISPPPSSALAIRIPTPSPSLSPPALAAPAVLPPPAPSPAARPRPQEPPLRALRYRIESADRRYPQPPPPPAFAVAAMTPIANVNGGTRRRLSRNDIERATPSALEDYAVNVVANMIDGSQRRFKDYSS